MGKDRKQREAYKYLHGLIDEVHPNIERGWNRHNFDQGPARKRRKEIKEKEIDKVIEIEVFDYIHI